MSKSKGNVVDPKSEVKKYGVDAFRYCLLREVQFGNDGDYSVKSVVTRINADLANDLGNLLNRTLGMYKKYFDGVIVDGNTNEALDAEIENLWNETVKDIDKFMNMASFSRALEAIWKFISRLNKYIDENTPWTLAKDEEKKDRLATVMNKLVNSLYKIAVLIYPTMPESAQKIWEQLGVNEDIKTAKIENVMGWDNFKAGHKLGEATPIFPRLDLDEILAQDIDPMQVNPDLKIENEIGIETFDAVDINVVEILEVDKVKKADKLLKFKVSLGDHVRQILSGVAASYPNPSELVGKKVLAVTNLKPRKMKGEISQGMLLSTEKDGKIQLLFVDNANIGAKLK